MNITLSNPKYLFLLFLIPLFIFLHFASIRGRSKKALNFANYEAISRVSGADMFSKNITTLLLSCFILVILVLSISGPRVHLTREVSEASFVFAIDLSQSMTADDFKPNRLEFAKSLSKDFIDIIPDMTKIGIVSFGAYSLIENDITIEKEQLRTSLDKLEISSIGGTGFYETFVTSSNILFNEDVKVVVLFSDGQSTIEDVEVAVRYAVSKGLMIYTIPIGTISGAEAVFGLSKLDSDTLNAISYQTGGVFIEGTDAESLKENFKSAIVSNRGIVAIDVSAYLVLFAILLFAIECILINLR